jgi:hypothetical protein
MSPKTINGSPYSDQKSYDLQIPVCGKCIPAALSGVPYNADNLIEFIDTALRPWSQELASPNAAFDRDALYGHSFGGLFVVYVLVARPDLFDKLPVASPALFGNNDYVHTGFLELLKEEVTPSWMEQNLRSKSATASHLEQDPVRRGMETADVFESRKSILAPMRMMDLINKSYSELKGSPALRDVELYGHPFGDHAAAGAPGRHWRTVLITSSIGRW